MTWCKETEPRSASLGWREAAAAPKRRSEKREERSGSRGPDWARSTCPERGREETFPHLLSSWRRIQARTGTWKPGHADPVLAGDCSAAWFGLFGLPNHSRLCLEVLSWWLDRSSYKFSYRKKKSRDWKRLYPQKRKNHRPWHFYKIQQPKWNSPSRSIQRTKRAHYRSTIFVLLSSLIRAELKKK